MPAGIHVQKRSHCYLDERKVVKSCAAMRVRASSTVDLRKTWASRKTASGVNQEDINGRHQHLNRSSSEHDGGVDVVPGTLTTHEVPLAGTWIPERSEGRVVGEPEELMEEGNIVLLRDCRRGALRITSVCRALPIWPHTDAAGEKERRGCLVPSSSSCCGILRRSAEL